MIKKTVSKRGKNVKRETEETCARRDLCYNQGMKTVLYRAEQLSALERKIRIWTAVFALVCAAVAEVMLDRPFASPVLSVDSAEGGCMPDGAAIEPEGAAIELGALDANDSLAEAEETDEVAVQPASAAARAKAARVEATFVA